MAKVLLCVGPDASLRLPPDVLRSAGSGERVELDLQLGSLSLRSGEADGDDLTEQDVITICGEIR